MADDSTEEACTYCGIELRGRGCFDHVIPRSGGGTNDPSNLVRSCHVCNESKQADSVEDFTDRYYLSRREWRTVFACLECGAPPGTPCQSKRGKDWRYGEIHRGRGRREDGSLNRSADLNDVTRAVLAVALAKKAQRRQRQWGWLG